MLSCMTDWTGSGTHAVLKNFSAWLTSSFATCSFITVSIGLRGLLGRRRVERRDAQVLPIVHCKIRLNALTRVQAEFVPLQSPFRFTSGGLRPCPLPSFDEYQSRDRSRRSQCNRESNTECGESGNHGRQPHHLAHLIP